MQHTWSKHNLFKNKLFFSFYYDKSRLKLFNVAFCFKPTRIPSNWFLIFFQSLPFRLATLCFYIRLYRVYRPMLRTKLFIISCMRITFFILIIIFTKRSQSQRNSQQKNLYSLCSFFANVTLNIFHYFLFTFKLFCSFRMTHIKIVFSIDLKFRRNYSPVISHSSSMMLFHFDAFVITHVHSKRMKGVYGKFRNKFSEFLVAKQ